MDTVVTTPLSRIGILGGSFDPVHNGHLAVAQLACEHFSLHKVFFIPANIQPHKKQSIPVTARHRLAMLKSAITGNSNFCIWDGEIKRGGISFTVDTVHALKEMHPDAALYFIIGSDNFSEIRTWNRYKRILAMVTLCVAHRPGYAIRIPAELSEIEVISFPSPEWGISSSKLRSHLNEGKSCRYMLPEKVALYIQKNKLYLK